MSAPRFSTGCSRAAWRHVLAAPRRHRSRRSTEEFADGIRARSRLARPRSGSARSASRTRTARYAAAAETLEARGPALSLLRDRGRARPQRKRQLARGLPPIYDRAALKLDADASAPSSKPRGGSPHWRFRLANTEPTRVCPAADHRLVERSHPRRPDRRHRLAVRSRADPRRRHAPLHLHQRRRRRRLRHHPRHPRRGSRHQHRRADRSSSRRWREPPAFAHHSLLIGADGQALSKRLGALSIESLRDGGPRADGASLSHAALLGTSDAIEPLRALDELAALFDLRQDLERARPLRCRGAAKPQREAAAQAALTRPWRAAARARSASPAAPASGRRCAATSPCSTTRARGGGRQRPDSSRYRGRRYRAAAALLPRSRGRRHLGRLDRRLKAATGARAGAVPPVAAGADRPRGRPRNEARCCR